MQPSEKPNDFEIVVFFDGKCSACVRMQRHLSKLDNKEVLDLRDMHKSKDTLNLLGLDVRDLQNEIYGVTKTGTLLRGIDVFIFAYGICGYRGLVWPLKVWPFRWFFALAYKVFARWRYLVFKRGGITV